MEHSTSHLIFHFLVDFTLQGSLVTDGVAGSESRRGLGPLKGKGAYGKPTTGLRSGPSLQVPPKVPTMLFLGHILK